MLQYIVQQDARRGNADNAHYIFQVLLLHTQYADDAVAVAGIAQQHQQGAEDVRQGKQQQGKAVCTQVLFFDQQDTPEKPEWYLLRVHKNRPVAPADDIVLQLHIALYPLKERPAADDEQEGNGDILRCQYDLRISHQALQAVQGEKAVYALQEQSQEDKDPQLYPAAAGLQFNNGQVDVVDHHITQETDQDAYCKNGHRDQKYSFLVTGVYGLCEIPAQKDV